MPVSAAVSGELYSALDLEFHFTYIAGSEINREWSGICWCSPEHNFGEWVAKARAETRRGVTTVMLLPARTDTHYFHEYIYGQHEVRFLRGRLKMPGTPNSISFPSMLVIFRAASGEEKKGLLIKHNRPGQSESKINEEFHEMLEDFARRKFYGEVTFYIQGGNIESSRISERKSKSEVKAQIDAKRGYNG